VATVFAVTLCRLCVGMLGCAGVVLVDMLVDRAELLLEECGVIGIRQLGESFFDRHLDAGTRLLFFAPVEHQPLALQGVEQRPRDLFDLRLLGLRKGDVRLGQYIEQRQLLFTDLLGDVALLLGAEILGEAE